MDENLENDLSVELYLILLLLEGRETSLDLDGWSVVDISYSVLFVANSLFFNVLKLVRFYDNGLRDREKLVYPTAIKSFTFSCRLLRANSALMWDCRWELEQTLLCEAKICDLREGKSREGVSEVTLDFDKLAKKTETKL